VPEHIRKDLEEMDSTFSNQKIKVSVSIGVSTGIGIAKKDIDDDYQLTKKTYLYMKQKTLAETVFTLVKNESFPLV
jgi:GGDEF domain-containing protein